MRRICSLVVVATLAAAPHHCMAERLAFRGPEGALAFLRLESIYLDRQRDFADNDAFRDIRSPSVEERRAGARYLYALLGQLLVDEQEGRNLSDSAEHLSKNGSVDVAGEA